jgi:hypothetical protein
MTTMNNTGFWHVNQELGTAFLSIGMLSLVLKIPSMIHYGPLYPLTLLSKNTDEEAQQQKQHPNSQQSTTGSGLMQGTMVTQESGMVLYF